MDASTRSCLPVRRYLCTLALTLTTAVVACDQPTQPLFDDADGGVQSVITSVTPVDCSASALPGPKYLDLLVRLSTGEPAAGAVVTVLSPTHGVLCSGPAEANGRIRFEGLKHGAEVVISVRDEVNPNVVDLEIVPPNPVAAPLLADQPSDADNRQSPALFAGAGCVMRHELTWAGYLAARAAPCVITAPGVGAILQLGGNAPSIVTRVLDASNQPLSGVLVAALSPANTSSSDLTANCAVLPWVDQTECTTNSNGPALLQSLGLTGTDGRIALGVSFGSDALNPQPVVIETIAEQGGQTLFGTLVQTAGGEQSLLTSPGMCMVETVPDETEPSGTSELDIRSSAHSVGLTTSVADATGAPLAAPALVPVNSTLIVKLHVNASTIGGTGSYTLQYRLANGGIQSVRASFGIGAGHPDVCTVSAATGNGVGDGTAGPSFTGMCAPNATAPADLEAGRRAYTLFFVLTGVDASQLRSAEYDIRTDHDHLDPSRSHPAFDRGGVNFTGLNADSCPVRLNNDGRWLTV